MKNFLYGLALLFIGLKLTGYISDWSWWTVLSPLIAVQLNEFLADFVAGWKEVRKQRLIDKRIIEKFEKSYSFKDLSNFERKMEELKSKGNG